MKRCICNTEPTVTCAGMKYYVSCPKCGLATDMYDTLEDAEKAWDSRRVEMGKYVLKVVEEKKAIEKKKDVPKVAPQEEDKVVPKEDKVVPGEEPKVVPNEEPEEEPKEDPKEDKVVPKEDKVVPKEEPEEEPRPYKKRTRKEK